MILPLRRVAIIRLRLRRAAINLLRHVVNRLRWLWMQSTIVLGLQMRFSELDVLRHRRLLVRVSLPLPPRLVRFRQLVPSSNYNKSNRTTMRP